MLFILTGDIQIGKTRWLQRLIGSLERRGVVAYGVVAPGMWIEHADGETIAYEKIGINNELLPQHEIVPFARRADLAAESSEQGAWTQAQRAQLAWAIEDDAIRRVNEHFEKLACLPAFLHEPRADQRGLPASGEAPDSQRGLLVSHEAPDRQRDLPVQHEPRADRPGLPTSGEASADQRGLLVIDELGRLELLREEGLTSAMRLLDRGATSAVPHALIIVREQLLECALERFASASWGGLQPISPGSEAESTLMSAYPRTMWD